MKGRTDVRTVDDVMAIKPNFLASMGYQHFLSYGAPCACAFGTRGAPLLPHLEYCGPLFVGIVRVNATVSKMATVIF